MSNNLTENQKELVRLMVAAVRAGHLKESVSVEWGQHGKPRPGNSVFATCETLATNELVNFGTFSALVAAHLLVESVRSFPRSHGAYMGGQSASVVATVQEHVYSLTEKAYKAVDSNFSEEPVQTPISTIAHSAPPELNLSLDRLRTIYPDPAKLGFLVMRFTKGKAFSGIVSAVKETAEKHGITILRADDHQFHADLWSNVRTFLHGCGFGIAVYERIEQEEANANVGLEVGYLLAMNKPVLLLKERTVKALQADLMGKLYKEFDEHDPAGSIPDQLTKWMTDNGVIV